MPSKAKPSANTRRFKEVVRFLLGEVPLDGRWFGGDPPTTKTGRPKPYWWRTELRGVAEKILFDLWRNDPRNLLNKD